MIQLYKETGACCKALSDNLSSLGLLDLSNLVVLFWGKYEKKGAYDHKRLLFTPALCFSHVSAVCFYAMVRNHVNDVESLDTKMCNLYLFSEEVHLLLRTMLFV